MSKLWIIGDSFTSCGSNFWVNILAERFKTNNYYISSRPSRDFQTILDTFLTNLKDISNDDFVIIVIPSLGRTRLPLKTPISGVSCTSLDNHPTDRERYNDHIDYFIGSSMYTHQKELYQLEEPLMDIDESTAINQSEFWSIVNASEASKKNYIKILTSLKQYLPFELYIFSWVDEIQSPIIENKTQITQGVGYWDTLYDEWIRTNGAGGSIGDHHFSLQMHRGFADYLTHKFSNWFTSPPEEEDPHFFVEKKIM